MGMLEAIALYQETKKMKAAAQDDFLQTIDRLKQQTFDYKAIAKDIADTVLNELESACQGWEFVSDEKSYMRFIEDLPGETIENRLYETKGFPSSGEYAKVIRNKGRGNTYKYMPTRTTDNTPIGEIGKVTSTLKSLKTVYVKIRNIQLAFHRREVVRMIKHNPYQRYVVVEEKVTPYNIKEGDLVRIVKTGDGKNYSYGGDADAMPIDSVGPVESILNNSLRATFPDGLWSLAYKEVCKVEKYTDEAEKRKIEPLVHNIIVEVEQKHELYSTLQERQEILKAKIEQMRDAGFSQYNIDKILEEKGMRPMTEGLLQPRQPVPVPEEKKPEKRGFLPLVYARV